MIPRVCSVSDCTGKVVAKGMCDKHYRRVRRNGTLEFQKPGYGQREKHPLYNSWSWHHRKNRSRMCQEWQEDFWAFARDVEERPSKRHFLQLIDSNGVYCKGNVKWRAAPEIESKDRREYNRKYQRHYRKMHPERIKSADLKRMFGITLEQYNALLAKQGGVCAICRQPESVERYEYLAVDHDHASGEVRGLLCHNCNTGIGKLQEDVEFLEAAVRYLRGEQEVIPGVRPHLYIAAGA